MESHASKTPHHHFNSPPTYFLSRSQCLKLSGLWIPPIPPFSKKAQVKEGDDFSPTHLVPHMLPLYITCLTTVTSIPPPPSSHHLTVIKDSSISPPSLSSMALRPPLVAVLLLWVTILVLLLNGWSQVWMSSGSVDMAVWGHPSSVGRQRKMLVSKFDFSAFRTRGHHHRGHSHRQGRRGASHHILGGGVGLQPTSPGDGDEIDPRYGVQKRLVPTGPNPLHH